MKPSIDLAAELTSITRRQHLNDVHFAVALVRHAARARPTQIRVRLQRRRVRIEHDGRPLDELEHSLLLRVLSGDDDVQRQHALAELEAAHGVSILTALVTSGRAVLESTRSLEVDRGQAKLRASGRARGWAIDLRRAVPSLAAARRELRFYCANCPIPVIVNGRDVTGPLTLRETVLRHRFKSPAGTGLCGVPKERALSRVRYYKHGVYFGVRSSLPSDGRAVEATFNSTLDEVEDNFRRSIHAGNRALRTAREELFDDAARRFTNLDEADRETLFGAFLRVPTHSWTEAMREAPVLHTVRARWSRSVAEVRRVGRAHGVVPYTLRADNFDGGLLLLTPQAVRAVRKLAGAPLHRALDAPALPPEAPEAMGRSGLPVPPALAALVDTLSRRGVQLVLTDGQTAATRHDGERRVVELAHDHPALAKIAAFLALDPGGADIATLAVVAAADPAASATLAP